MSTLYCKSQVAYLLFLSEQCADSLVSWRNVMFDHLTFGMFDFCRLLICLFQVLDLYNFTINMCCDADC
jgi:hypothetical protein